MRIDRRLLGWGLFLILVGTIPLATRAGLLDREIVGQWPSLWPLLLIGWGIGLLLRRTPIEWLGGAVAAVVFGIMGGGLLASGFAGAPISTGCGGQGSGTAFATQSGTIQGGGRLEVDLSCGSLTMRPSTGSTWSVSGTESNGEPPRVDIDGSRVSIDAGDRGRFFGRGERTDWTVEVPNEPELGLGITINAGRGTIETGDANLASVDMTVNAGSAELLLSRARALGDVDVTVNAGSAVVHLLPGGRSADLSLNAGSLTVCMAPGAAMRVSWSGALGSNDLAAAGLTEVESNTWETPNLSASTPYLDVDVSANAGSFRLDLDGSCDA